VRYARRQAEAGVTATFDVVRSPLLAALGALDIATKAATEALGKVRSEAADRAEEAQSRWQKTLQELQARVSDLPAEFGELRHRLEPAELRKLAEEYGEAAQRTYAALIERGAEIYDELRNQPRVQQALDSVEFGVDTAQERLERVVEEVNVAVDEMRSRFARTSRAVGEQVARGTEEVTTETSRRVQDAAGKVQHTADDLSKGVSEAGQEAAATTRSTTRKVADRAAPPRKPVTRRPGDNTTRKA
jgi:heparin binding hemagglutinin HbhA